MGGMLVLVLAGLWMGRKHLKEVFVGAFSRTSKTDDSDEIISYRAAVFMLLGGCAVLVVWLWMVGMPIWAAAALLFLALVLFFGFTRVVAEGAYLMARCRWFRPAFSSRRWVHLFWGRTG